MEGTEFGRGGRAIDYRKSGDPGSFGQRGSGVEAQPGAGRACAPRRIEPDGGFVIRQRQQDRGAGALEPFRCFKAGIEPADRARLRKRRENGAKRRLRLEDRSAKPAPGLNGTTDFC